VLLWNPHDEERELGVEAAVLAELGSGPWSGYDFWPNRALGRLDGVVPARAVAPGGCRVVGLTPPSAGPVVIGSSLHLGMGTREVAQLRAEAGLLILRLRHRGRHEGDVWIQLPKRDAPLRIPVSFRDQVERRIRIP
jgi:hypothetical protein